MSPWEILLFVSVSAVVALLVTILVVAIVTVAKDKKPCEGCGHVNTGKKDKT